MNIIAAALQVVIALCIFNVWLLRFNKATGYRGGEATNLREEFAVYGLPAWSVYLIGGLKLTLAVLLLVGLWLPQVVAPAAIGMALLMAGAVSMHVRVGDPPKRAAPAAAMLAMSIFVALA